ncbi:hypothetical protein Scep_011199 [Stephania cephalantha]|uniref:Uncharacterized protein n=1 Tax=Stephania cephalantha TaxID=152367 RepID=A0AAP0JEH4_9MAGN
MFGHGRLGLHGERREEEDGGGVSPAINFDGLGMDDKVPTPHKKKKKKKKKKKNQNRARVLW